jgi:hypothetical protein
MRDDLRELWNRIERFSIDAGGDAGDESLTFADRLARENGWTTDYANRVVEEYKKFIYLMVAAGHPVTPSDQVDQAWHLHLTYTRSYWDRLCGQIIGRPLHHEPTKGGSNENEKFNDWYNRTLETYERFFGAAPPADIWPAAAIRFSMKNRFQRVNLGRAWVLSKVRSWRKVALLCLIGLAVLAVGCSQDLMENSLGLMTTAVVFVIAAIIIISKWHGRGSGHGCSGGCGGVGCSHSSGCGSGCGSGCSSGCGGGGCGAGCGS